jgi:hypothetical protein
VYDSDATNYTDIKGGDGTAQSTNLSFVLPTDAGSNGKVLSTDGSGQLSWTNVSGVTTNTLDGLIDSKFSGLNFSNSLLLGHEQTGTLNNAINNNAVGKLSLENISSGDNNSAIGYGSLQSITSGSNNVAIGDNAGNLVSAGSGNVFIGSNAGANEIGSNTLYIDNSNTSTPLIQGYFSTNELTINGTLGVTGVTTMNAGTSNSFSVPASRGTAGQYLVTDGSGASTWGNITSIQGVSISSTTPTNNQALLYDSGNSSWVPSAMTIDKLTDGKSGGSNFANSIIVGHETTGTLNNANANNALGILSMSSITSGDNNSALGHASLQSITSGSNNVAIGDNAGNLVSTGSGNVFIGSNSGANETGSNSLYIDNSNTSTPLIKGDFAGNALTINGTIGVTGITTMNSGTGNSFTVPASRGNSGQYLMTDGTGSSTWSNISSIQGRSISSTMPANNNSLMWDSVNQTWKPGVATSAITVFTLSEGTSIDVDALRGGTTRINNINISAHAFFRLVNASSGCDLTGFQNGSNGRIIYFLNTSGSNQTFQQENTNSAPENRLILGVANKTIGDKGTITFIYSTTLNRWVMISST